jgi:putative oxidoreductase
MKHWLIGVPVTDLISSVGLLLFRIVFGGFMLIGHGWGKLMSYGEMSATFPDPLGIGSGPSLIGAIIGEVVCSALVILGLATRVAVLPLVFTMAIAAFIVHASDPFATKELALVYLSAFGLLFFTGPGCFSIDMRFNKSK